MFSVKWKGKLQVAWSGESATASNQNEGWQSLPLQSQTFNLPAILYLKTVFLLKTFLYMQLKPDDHQTTFFISKNIPCQLEWYMILNSSKVVIEIDRGYSYLAKKKKLTFLHDATRISIYGIDVDLLYRDPNLSVLARFYNVWKPKRKGRTSRVVLIDVSSALHVKI